MRLSLKAPLSTQFRVETLSKGSRVTGEQVNQIVIIQIAAIFQAGTSSQRFQALPSASGDRKEFIIHTSHRIKINKLATELASVQAIIQILLSDLLSDALG